MAKSRCVSRPKSNALVEVLLISIAPSPWGLKLQSQLMHSLTLLQTYSDINNDLKVVVFFLEVVSLHNFLIELLIKIHIIKRKTWYVYYSIWEKYQGDNHCCAFGFFSRTPFLFFYSFIKVLFLKIIQDWLCFRQF